MVRPGNLVSFSCNAVSTFLSSGFPSASASESVQGTLQVRYTSQQHRLPYTLCRSGQEVAYEMATDNMPGGLSLEEPAPSGDLLRSSVEPMEEQESVERISEILQSGALHFSLKMFPIAQELPPRPPPANECNFTHYYAIDVGKEFHDQYIFRHANGLCVVGLAPSHAAFQAKEIVTAVDYNVGKTSRADMKAVGKRKKNATVLEGNSVLCKVLIGEIFFLIRCCVRGTLLEVNQRLIENPQLLVSTADTEGYIAVLMPRPEDWAKVEKSFLTQAEYRAQRGLPV